MNPAMRLITFSILTLFFALFVLDAPAAATNGDDARVKVMSTDTLSLRTQLESAGYDVVGRNGPEGFVEVIASPQEFEALRSAGHNVAIIETFANRKQRSVPAGYRDYYECVQRLNVVADAYPTITQLIDVGAAYGTGTTYEDRILYAMKISDNVMTDEDEPNIWIVSNHHAREIMTPEFALWIIDELTTGYGSNPEVTNWVNANQIYIGVTWNPDGLQYCHDVDDWWRKNRKPAGGGYYGIDLNRNFDFNWDGPYGGSTSPYSDTYRGPYPESEEETYTEVPFSLDRHFAKVLDFHSYGSEVLYTYASSSSFPSTLESWYQSKAVEFSYALNYGGSHRKPSAEGEHYEWQLCDIGGFCFLVETGYEFQPVYSTAESEFTDHIWPGVQWFLSHEISLQGHVTDAATGLPVVADITVDGINYTQGEVRKSEPKFGRYHYFLPPGSYSVTFSTDGYDPVTENVTIVADNSTLLEVQLGGGPVLDIMANGDDGPLTVTTADNVEFTVALDPGTLDGNPADWWIFGEKDSNKTWWAKYRPGQSPKWTKSTAPIRFAGATLRNVNSYTVLGPRTLPAGSYVFTFAVDDNKDGIYDGTFGDTVEVTVL